MPYSWRRFKQLSPLEKGFLLRAFVLLPAIGWGLRMFGFVKIQAWLCSIAMTAPGKSPVANDAALNIADAAVRMIGIAARRGIHRANCLPTSLALAHLLRTQSISTELRIGVRMVAGVLKAHAWVEYQNQALNDDMTVHDRYPAFAESFMPKSRSTP